MKRITVLIADNDGLARSRIRQLLEKMPEVDVVGEADANDDALELAQRRNPAVVVLDFADSTPQSLDLLGRFHAELPRVGVMLLVSEGHAAHALDALAAGVAGYLRKPSAIEELPLAVRAVAAGEAFLSPAIARPVIEGYLNHERPVGARLAVTPRQREVLQLVAARKTSRQIADELGLSVRTVETHRADLMARMGVNNTAQLMQEAERLGLTEVQQAG